MRKSIYTYILLSASFLLVISHMAVAGKKKKTENEELARQQEAEYVYTEGLRQLVVNGPEKAIFWFESSKDKNPNVAGVYFSLADAYLKTNQLDKAEKNIKLALELDKNNKYFYLLAAETQEKKGNYEQAANYYNQLIKKERGGEQYLFDLATVYIYAKKYDDAIKTFEKIEKEYGVIDEAVRQKQQLLLRENKLDEAIAEGQKLITTNPDEPRYKVMQAELLFNNNRKTEAEAICKELSSKQPYYPANLILSEIYKSNSETEKSKEQLQLAFTDPDMSLDDRVNIIIGMFSLVEKDSNALKDINKLTDATIKLHPNDSKAHSLKGDVEYYSGHKANAIQEYKKVVALDSSKFKIWQQIIALEMESAHYDSVIRYSDKATELFPTQGVLWFYNGTAKLIRKNSHEAIKSLEQAQKLSESNQDMENQINSQLGDAYNAIKNYPKSDAAYEEVLKYEPNNYHVLNNYGYNLSLRKEKLDQAKKMVKKVVIAYPDEANYLDTYGWILYVAKDYEEAKIYLEKAIKDSDNGTILEHYGDVLYQLGKKDEALKFWKRAKEKGDATELIDKKIADKKLYE